MTLVTDHHPNIYLRTQPHLSRRQVSWVEWLERFNYEWKYIPGRENVADPLSRNPNLYGITVGEQGNVFEFDEDIELNFIALAEALDEDISSDLGVSHAMLPRFLEGYKADPYFDL